MVNVQKSKFTMLHSFFIPQRLLRCKLFFRYWWDDDLSSASIQVREDESQEDYDVRLSDVKALIKQSIKKGNLYGSKDFN
jgi:hypothetical protein